MNITNVAAVSVVILVFYVGARYCLKFLRGKSSPRIATWLVFEIGVAMSLVSYFAGHDHSLIKAALNVGRLLSSHRHSSRAAIWTWTTEVGLYFKRTLLIVDIRNRCDCLDVHKGRLGGFIGFQTVMSVAYLPTLQSLWRWEPGTHLDHWTNGA